MKQEYIINKKCIWSVNYLITLYTSVKLQDYTVYIVHQYIGTELHALAVYRKQKANRPTLYL